MLDLVAKLGNKALDFFSFTEIRTNDLNFMTTSFLVYSGCLSADIPVKKG